MLHDLLVILIQEPRALIVFRYEEETTGGENNSKGALDDIQPVCLISLDSIRSKTSRKALGSDLPSPARVSTCTIHVKDCKRDESSKSTRYSNADWRSISRLSFSMMASGMLELTVHPANTVAQLFSPVKIRHHEYHAGK